ncbi:MAG: putative Ig domain-containing protein, partial [Rhodanobacteraceae bacterium]|nr:putative Ig domain-containing protein [Rhodanobacteraceae bacterium]
RMFQTAAATPSVTIGVSPASVSEDGATNLVYTVTRSLNLPSSTTVNIATSGTATAGVDYTGNVASVTIPANATTATVTINPGVDATVEPDETVILTLTAGSGYTLGAPISATGTILNDDVPSATISVSPASVAEDGATNLVYTVTLNQAAFNPISVNYTIGGTATNGGDYAATASPLLIPTGNTTGTITVNPTVDATIEANETVSLMLTAGTGYTVGAPNNATGTILNDDLPNLTINDVTASEGNAGVTNFTFTVSLSAPAGPGGVTFDIASANGTATAGVDYVANSLAGQTIPAGSSTYTFTVQVNGDALNEPSETFFSNVTNVVNAVVVDGQGVGTIVNDDPLPSLGINDVTVVEGNAGTVNAVFTVGLSAASGQTVSVNYATADGTATQPADYSSASGALTFTPGQTVQTVSVPVIGETVPEANETFFVNLSGGANATIADNQGVGSITNDDVPITVSPGSLPNGTVAVAYSQTITASGGVDPYAFTVSAGALPAGLSLSPGGALTGTPTAGGSFSFTVTATDSSPFPGPFSGSQAYTLTVAPATIVLPPVALAGGTLGAAYSASISPASGGTAPYAYAVTAGALPGGLTLNSASGAITGTPGALGTFNFDITATDSSTGTGPYTATQSYSITVIDVPPTATDSTLSVAYNAPATGVPLTLGGGTPTSLSIGTPPLHGTALVTGPNTITYQPTTGYAGADGFTYTATNSGGTSAPATVSVTVQDAVISISNGGSLSGTVAIAYSETFTFNGGAQPWSGYQVTNLPTGVSVTANTATTVTISGTPAQAGSFNLNVSATDSSTGNGPYTIGQAFVLNVAAPSLTLNPAPTTFNPVYASPYTQSFVAGGGIGPYTYAVTGTLPTGLTLTGDTVSGTPTAPGNYVVLITATDTGASGTGSPFSVGQSYTFDVAAPTISATPATLANGTVGVAYSAALVASGGEGPYSFTPSGGSLPVGLTLNSDGSLSGTPTSAGTFSFDVSISDANSQPGSSSHSLTIDPPGLVLSPPAGTLNAAYNSAFGQVFSVSGGVGPFTYALTSGTLPTGLSLAGDTLSGTPTQVGSFPITVTATDTGTTGGALLAKGIPFTVSENYTVTVAAPVISLSPATLGGGTVGVPYAQNLSASGGIGPYAFTVATGSLPPGLTLSTAGAIGGSPTANGSFAFSVEAADANGLTGTAAYNIVVAALPLTLGPGSLPGGSVGAAYLQNLQPGGGVPPYQFVVSGGALPPGLSLAADGTLSGTPTQNGTYSFTVSLSDNAVPASSVSQTYTLLVGVPAIASPELIPATNPWALLLMGLLVVLAGSLTITRFRG